MSWTWVNRWIAKVRADPVLRDAYEVDECEAMGREIDRRLAEQMKASFFGDQATVSTPVDGGEVITLDDLRPFDVGTPRCCYRCGAEDDVQRQGGEGGYVYACPRCPHPAD